MFIDSFYEMPPGLAHDILSSIGPLETRFGELSNVIFYDKYSRPQEHAPTLLENSFQAAVRVVEGVLSIRLDWYKKNNIPWDVVEANRWAARLLTAILRLQFLPPGRGLWAMGSQQVVERGSMALNNCAAVEVNNENFCAAVQWGINALMHGVGVGFGIATEEVGLRRVLAQNSTGAQYSTTHIVEDSREGWALSASLALTSDCIFDYSALRPRGAPLKTFGGRASGPAPLMILHKRLRAYRSLFLSSTYSATRFTADVVNAAGCCVVAGNTRRSAEILIGSTADREFLSLKEQPESVWSLALDSTLNEVHTLVDKEGKLENAATLLNAIPDRAFLFDRPNIMWMSNNTVRLAKGEDFIRLSSISKRIALNGEPGGLNILNVQRYGRLRDENGKGISNDKAWLCNPCGEIALESFELCNLAEVFPTHCRDIGELMESIEVATFYSQTVSLLQTQSSETNAVVSRNRRIGVSLTGIAEWQDTIGTFIMTRAIRDGYRVVTRTAARLAAEAGVPAPIRHTTVKPSGTVSLLAGVSSGMHYPTFSRAIRRILIDKDSAMDAALSVAGYPREQSLTDHNSVLFSFPISYGNVRSAARVSAWEQLCLAATLQREWADNMVSCSIYFNELERRDLSKMLGQFAPILKSFSLFPLQTHTYQQAPFESITQDEFERRTKAVRPVDWSAYRSEAATERMARGTAADLQYCETDHCLLPQQ